MYRGVARLLGMRVQDAYQDLDDACRLIRESWQEGDFYFLHFKDTDKAGEDGDFDRKVAAIEDFDSIVPRLLELGPDVLAVTGDHSTPARMKQHSWHPVPAVVHAPATARPDGRSHFGEGACRAGTLGHRPMSHLMSLLLAHAGRLRPQVPGGISVTAACGMMRASTAASLKRSAPATSGLMSI